jgi:hypothetical protein
VLKRHVARGEASFSHPTPAGRRELAAVVRSWRDAAAQGSALAQHNLGCLCEKGRGVAQSDAAAAKWHRKAAGRGLAAAQFALGYMCEHGRAGKGGGDSAVQWYRKAAVQGDAKAQCNLGVLYDKVMGS